MKPFDLEAAKAGKPLVQRDGTKVRFIAHVPDALTSSRIIVMSENCRVMSFRAEDGRYINGSDRSGFDLQMASTKKTYWAHVWRDRHGVFVGALFATEQLAAKNKKEVEEGVSYTYLKTIQVEIEE